MRAEYKTPTQTEFQHVMHNYWMMMRECERYADNENDNMLKRWVEGYYRKWNDMQKHESNLQPRWKGK